MEVKSSHDMDNGHFWALCPFEAPFPKHKKDSFWHEMPKKAYQTNLQWSSLLLWIWHKVFQLLFVELLTKLIGLFTTETPSSTADIIMQRVSFPPGKIHGFEVWLTSGTAAGQKGDFPHLWKIAFCRGNEWLSSLNPHLLFSTVQQLQQNSWWCVINIFLTFITSTPIYSRLASWTSKLPIGMHFFFYPKNIKTLLLLLLGHHHHF